MADPTPDEDLMLKVRDGSAEAFTELYVRHRNGLLGFCYRLLRNWEDAADVLQEAFRYVYLHARTYRPSAKFTTYLFQIARNTCIDILRKRRRRKAQPLDPSIDVPDPAPAGATPMERGEVESRIKEALDQVPDPYREALHLRIVEELEYEEIARILGCPAGTVKSRLHTGLEILREAIRRKKIVE